MVMYMFIVAILAITWPEKPLDPNAEPPVFFERCDLFCEPRIQKPVPKHRLRVEPYLVSKSRCETRNQV